MRCAIYKSRKKEELYLFVAAGRGLDQVPEALMAQFGHPEPVMDLELTPERTLARCDTEEVLNSLREKGYYLQLPPAHPQPD